MTAQGDSIVAFLDSAITARECKATAAAGEHGADWYYEDGFVRARREDDMVATGSQDFLERKQGEHIALNDPASVLRRCAADRKLIAEHRRLSLPPDVVYDECRLCGESNEAWPCPTLVILAEGYGWTEGER